jgi:hypothetical protein
MINHFFQGFNSMDLQVFELYNTKAQTEARTTSNTVIAQQWLLHILYTSDPESRIGLNQPISYYDRLRVRQPGDSKFALGPHIDGGSLERWEDAGAYIPSVLYLFYYYVERVSWNKGTEAASKKS